MFALFYTPPHHSGRVLWYVYHMVRVPHWSSVRPSAVRLSNRSYFRFRAITWVNVIGFSPNLVCALMLWRSGSSCSKLTMSLVNDLLKFTSIDTQICWNFLLKKSECKSYSHFFSKNTRIRILYIESAKTVNEMTLNELVKLTTLWTTGPWFRISNRQLLSICDRIICRDTIMAGYYIYIIFYWSPKAS